MAPISRREQLELDELLSDIYRGIETLPDTSADISKTQDLQQVATRHFELQDSRSKRTVGRAYVREYELDESSPLVQRHKRELQSASARAHAANSGNLSASEAAAGAATQPQRSTLKRQSSQQQQRVGTPAARSGQSLADFVTSNPLSAQTPSAAARATPEHKRRVRIVDPQQSPADYADENSNDYNYNNSYQDQQDNDDDEADYPREHIYSPFDSRQRVGGDSTGGESANGSSKKQKVKYVNTNKLIYHQERNPDDDDHHHHHQDQVAEDQQHYNEANDDDDDFDEATRVEYYHTSWLDRQLGRATRRRSSKELNERQVKEKAMIEELKRSLKNGAITLKQSFRGKPRGENNTKRQQQQQQPDDWLLDDANNKQHQIRDDYFARRGKTNNNNNRSVFGSGLATIPRNYSLAASPTRHEHSGTYFRQPQQQSPRVSGPYTSKRPTPLVAAQADKQQHAPSPMQQHSRTLPHKRSQEHQLLQSHYRAGARPHNFHQPDRSATLTSPHQQQLRKNQSHQQPQNMTGNSNTMPAQNQYSTQNQQNNAQWCPASSYADRPGGGAKSPLQQQASSTLNRMPSATEVVRSALSRSSSQASVSQLNKTINLLPNSPPPYAPSTTPTQQLRAASPSLSPSPAADCWPQQHQANIKAQQQPPTVMRTLDNGQVMLTGTRTVGRPPQQQPAAQSQQRPALQQQQTVYTNPHAALMQHRQEQQSRQPNSNSASIREFNELDSLLRSLSPTSAVPHQAPSTSVNRAPTQPGTAGGVSTQITPGFTSRPAQPSFGGFISQPQQQQQQQQDLYAKVHKQPYTIDVTDDKALKEMDENCARRNNSNLQQHQLSEFEPPADLLPSMEDYQNISKLNPVQNRYWYKPNMSRNHAISLLKDKPQGTFIVRDSTSFRGAYGLAVKVSKLPKNVLNNAQLRNYNNDPSAEFIRHFLIEPTGNGGVRLKGYANEPVFDNLADLIYQHSLTELALPCKLIIPRADIEDARFNQKQKQFFDEFLASKEQAKHQPYERTSPNGGYRRYPGNVLVHNEHRIIFE